MRRPHGPLPAPSPSLADAQTGKRCLSLVLFFFIFVAYSFAAEDYFFKANELYDQGKYKEAVPLYRAAIDEGRYEPFAWFNLGNALVQLDRKQVAMVAYKRTVELLPNFEKAWMLLGDLYYLADSPGDA
ncbi:MAG: tetratricopeptide repeat protein, partial [Fibrobacter sp.]|nr:tetratricopeptide repeat protein [Fibrobacter sp.]